MKIIAAIALVWLVCLVIGATFSILGKIIWVALLLTLIAAVWGFMQRGGSSNG